MIIKIPIKIVKLGKLQNNVITGEDDREVIDERVSYARVYVDEISSWHQVSFTPGEETTMVVTRTELYPTPMTVEDFEELLEEELEDMDSLSSKGEYLLSFLQKDL